MTGKFLKVSVENYIENISFSTGMICNNKNKDIAFDVIKSIYGMPNANLLRCDKSTWQYLLKYQNIFLSLYDYNNFWTLGFLELNYIIPDYSVINAFGKMLFEYLNKKIQLELELEAKKLVCE